MSNFKRIFQISKADSGSLFLGSLFLVGGLGISLIFAILAIVIVLNMAAKIDTKIDTRIDTRIDTINDSLLGKINEIDFNITTKLSDFNNINDKVENLSKKVDMQEQDIFYIQDSITDNKFNDLSISINNLMTMVENQEIDISSLKETQRVQLNSMDEFRKSIINKVSAMLFNSNNSDKKKENRSTFNKYILNSIEYRSNELWAVFLPKNARSLSELKFVTVGDLIDGWLIVSVNDKSVVLQKNNDKYKVELNEK